MFEIKGLSYTFFENQVNAIDDLSLSFEKGRVHALIGENGAGKSTLARIIAGHAKPRNGTMRLADRDYAPVTPAQALDAGVALVPQHPVLAGDLSVWQNLVLGRSCLGIDRRSGFLSKKKTLSGLRAKLRELGIDIPLEHRADSLDTAQVHWTAVAESVLANPSLLILDEPSAPYSHRDIERLYGLLRSLADAGAAVVVITHRLSEVLRFCDDIYVLRRGKLVAHVPTAKTNAEELQSLMFGVQEQTRDAQTGPATPAPATRESISPQEIGLKIRDVFVDDGPGRLLSGLTIEAARGTITGVLGLKDQGLEALEDLLAGIVRGEAGIILFDEKKLEPGNYRGYVPSRRFQRGIAPGLSIRDNAIVRSRRDVFPLGFYSTEKGQKLSGSRGFSADRPVDQGITTLSGGMIQRVIIERELSLPGPEFLVCAEPFWGLDTHFQKDLSAMLRDNAASGASVLVLSSDIDEAIVLCDRLYVLDKGKNAGFWEKRDYERDTIAAAMIHNLTMSAQGTTAE